jgi:hypothetical protein
MCILHLQVINSLCLHKVELPTKDDSIRGQLARWGHTFTAITHSEGLIEVILFGGSPGYYEVTWDVYKGKEFQRLSFPVSFILGEYKQFTLLIISALNYTVSLYIKYCIIRPSE